MSVTALRGNEAQDILLRKGVRFGFATMTLSAALVLTDDYPTILFLDPGGASRDVTLPTLAAGKEGLVFLISNEADAAEDLVVKDSGGTTRVTISQNEIGVVFSSDLAFRGGVMAKT